MKKLNIVLLVFGLFFTSYLKSQTIYFDTQDNKIMIILVEEFNSLGYKECQNKTLADYIIKVNDTKSDGGVFHATVTLFDKQENRLYMSKLIKSSSNAFNGYQARRGFMKKFKKKEIINFVSKLK